MSIAGNWNYDWAKEPYQYGAPWTYLIGMHWLEPCSLVEDWGCGCAFSKRFRKGAYRGIDGSPSKWTDHVADLEVYQSQTPGLFMRHILEHNPNWRTVLSNALGSFTERMALITFLPFSPLEFAGASQPAGECLHEDVPNIHLPEPELRNMLQPFLRSEVQMNTPDIEHVFFLSR